MLDSMTALKRPFALAITLLVGLWAGGAAAQSDDGEWFDGSRSSERPQLKIQGDGPYDPPPADFRSDPSDQPVPNASERDGGEDDEAALEEEADDAESQRRAVHEFSPHLAAYGYWVEDPTYGRVWVPTRSAVGPDFQPYVSAGHWELTPEDDWLWESDYPFGWVTFHYGRWVWGSNASWAWVPGYRYAPAWVDFRIGSSGYVGWGPAPAYSVWRNGVFVSVGLRHPVPYIFCPSTYVFSRSMPRYVIRDRYRVRSIAAQTYRYRPRVAGSVYVRGPRPSEARIAPRYIPTRRAIARPRYADSRSYALASKSRDVSSPRARSYGGSSYSRRDASFPSERRSQYSSGTSRGRSFGRDSADYQGRRSPRDDARGRSEPRSNAWPSQGRDTRRHDVGSSVGRSNVGRSNIGERMPAASPPRAPRRDAPTSPAAGSRRRRDVPPATSGSVGRRGEARSSRAPEPSSRPARSRSRDTRTNDRGRDRGNDRKSDRGSDRRGSR